MCFSWRAQPDCVRGSWEWLNKPILWMLNAYALSKDMGNTLKSVRLRLSGSFPTAEMTGKLSTTTQVCILILLVSLVKENFDKAASGKIEKKMTRATTRKCQIWPALAVKLGSTNLRLVICVVISFLLSASLHASLYYIRTETEKWTVL